MRPPSFRLVRTVSWALFSVLAFVAQGSGAPPPQAWPAEAFRPLSEERIANLPMDERAVWRAYWAESEARAKELPVRSTQEIAPAGPLSGSPKGGAHTKGLRLDEPPAWYGSQEAATIADRIVERQTVAGAWTKGLDYLRPRATQGEADVWSRGTFDNDATTGELAFLARTITATADPARSEAWQRAFLRGLDYIFAAQYPNGGFPQVYPLAGGYHDTVTFNDSAVTHVLELLRDIRAGGVGFEFVPVTRREEAGRRLLRGISCILAAQIETAGVRTVWGQQHDPLTLQPCAARNFEPIAASASESAALARFLMGLPDPTPVMVTSVEAAVAWFERVALAGVAWDRRAEAGSGLVPTAGSPRLWARLYEVGCDRPVFGDRDRTVHFVVTEISAERRLGYGWYGDWPEATIARYRDWRVGLAKRAEPNGTRPSTEK
jgi:PelA/Pel-15E family pectate lyase